MKKWSFFLDGQQFLIETDHRPLEFLRKENEGAQLIRIWEAIEAFDYTLRYKLGVDNGNSDAMSRVLSYTHEAGEPEGYGPADTDNDTPASEPKEETSDVTWAVNNARAQPALGEEAGDLRQQQREYRTWGTIIHEKKTGREGTTKLSRETRLDKNGILVRLPAATKGRGNRTPQISIPRGDSWHRCEGHTKDCSVLTLEERRTLQRLQGDDLWTGMSNDVRRNVANCRKCQQAKMSVSARAGKRHVLDEDEPSEPWQTVRVDHVVNLRELPAGTGTYLRRRVGVTHATIFMPVKTFSSK